MPRITRWILLSLLGLALAGCPDDVAELDEPGAVEPDVPDTTTAPATAEPTVPSATPYTGEDAAQMTINSKPWGQIYLDGKRVGNTPKRDYAIAPGEHEIKIQCGPCLEDDVVEWSFTVAAGEPYTHVRTEFDEQQPVVDHDFRHGIPDPDDGPDLTGGFVEHYQGDDPAFITLNSKPWSHVYMDGKYLGNTPKKRHAIAPGSHTLKLECGECGNPQTRELEINVAPGETYTEVRVEYTP